MNVLQGKKSISCANSVLPAFIGESSPGKCRGEPRRVQIDTTQNRPKTFMGQTLPAPAGSANRTAVRPDTKEWQYTRAPTIRNTLRYSCLAGFGPANLATGKT